MACLPGVDAKHLQALMRSIYAYGGTAEGGVGVTISSGSGCKPVIPQSSSLLRSVEAGIGVNANNLRLLRGYTKGAYGGGVGSPLPTAETGS